MRRSELAPMLQLRCAPLDRFHCHCRRRKLYSDPSIQHACTAIFAAMSLHPPPLPATARRPAACSLSLSPVSFISCVYR
jgi:hypothetical protein